MLKELKEFALKGNVMDMAVGIIIGAAFTTIVKSAVDDIIMPPIGMMMGGVDFADLFINLTDAEVASVAAAKEAGTFVLFMVIRSMNKLRTAEEEVSEAPEETPRNEVLLEEIRDLLKK